MMLTNPLCLESSLVILSSPVTPVSPVSQDQPAQLTSVTNQFSQSSQSNQCFSQSSQFSWKRKSSQSVQPIKTSQFSQLVQPISLASPVNPASPTNKFSHIQPVQTVNPTNQEHPVESASQNHPSCQSSYFHHQVQPVQLTLNSASPVSPATARTCQDSGQPELVILPTVPSHTSHIWKLLVILPAGILTMFWPAGILTMIRRPEYYHLYDVRSRKNPAAGLHHGAKIHKIKVQV